MMIRYLGHRMQHLWGHSVRCSRCTSNISTTVSLNLKSSEKNFGDSVSEEANPADTTITSEKMNTPVRKSSLVATAFSSIHSQKQPSNLMERLQTATTVEDLLSISEAQGFSPFHALQILSILADWTSKRNMKMSDFERDLRFVRLCKMLGRKHGALTPDASSISDLAVVLGITGDEQASNIVADISLSQKLQVLSTLAQKKRRSTHLLRALATNISKTSEKLDLKQAADVLYAMAVLNFPDDALLAKAVADFCSYLPANKKPAVVGSALTSLGFLRYKNEILMDTLTKWIEENIDACRVQDIVSLLLTLAFVNYHPKNVSCINEKILPNLSAAGMKPSVWLDVVWALVVLEMAENHHLQSVLEPSFIEKLNISRPGAPAAVQMKVLNINAAAQLTAREYKGPLLSDAPEWNVPLKRSREKQMLVDSVLDTLTNLLPSTSLRGDVDTGNGFLIDGECAVDPKCNPLPINSSAAPNVKRKRIAVMVFDYHDMCRGCEEVSGLVSLQLRLLKHMGYTVMTVTHLEFNPQDKLTRRVKYLETQLKTLASQPPL